MSVSFQKHYTAGGIAVGGILCFFCLFCLFFVFSCTDKKVEPFIDEENPPADTVTLPAPKNLIVDSLRIVHIDTTLKPLPSSPTFILKGHLFTKPSGTVDSMQIDTILGCLRIRWDGVNHAEKYQVSLIDDGGNTRQDTTAALRMIVTNIVVGKTYAVQVQARRPKKLGIAATTGGLRLFLPAPPSSISAVYSGVMNCAVSWQKNNQDFVTKYYVYLRDSVEMVVDSVIVDSSVSQVNFTVRPETVYKINIFSRSEIGMSGRCSLYVYDKSSSLGLKLPYVFVSTSTTPQFSVDPIVDTLVGIKGGAMVMGCIWPDTASSGVVKKALPYHEVMLSSFQTMKTEVTVGQFCQFLTQMRDSIHVAHDTVMSGDTVTFYSWGDDTLLLYIKSQDSLFHLSKKDSLFLPDSGFGNYPVTAVTWQAAVRFCNWLTVNSGQTAELCYAKNSSGQWIYNQQKKGFRLPSEAEFEYMQSFAFILGDSKRKYTWGYLDDQTKYGRTLSSVKRYTAFDGIYGLTGNCVEWCTDISDSLTTYTGGFSSYYTECYRNGIVKNPFGPSVGSNHVLRGGSFRSTGLPNTSWYRHSRSTGFGGNNLIYTDSDCGFRVVRSR
ncbi:MAG: SUMF1/EgtB/PvdO family nonheme iron enzyme [Chitinivibrionales bacterium]|nr:SUMF1/EgtB/PvdO family nonheme iron enzyme [Chitinivibrionales bacterium]